MPKVTGLIEQSLNRIPAGRSLRALLWRKLYDDLARKHGTGEFVFMNYGYAAENNPSASVTELSAALYARVVQPFDLADKVVVEVGSGRGGGAAFLAKTYGPKLMLGLDFSGPAVSLSQQLHNAPNLRYRQGDAGQLPLADGFADLIVNVESSHCYPSVDKFLAEAYRVLKPGGGFAWCDLRANYERDLASKQFADAGFEVFEEEEITPRVLQALSQAAEDKERLLSRELPGWMRPGYADFAAMPGTHIYNSLKDGERIYLRKAARKLS